MKNNTIPRKFDKIEIKLKVETNIDKAGDVLIVTKNKEGEYIAFNDKTKEKSCVFLSMLRNPYVVEIVNVY